MAEREAGGDRGAVDVVHLRFRRGARVVFSDLSCHFPPGRVSVVLGGSGSGKSTLLRLVAGLERPDAGEVRVDGAATGAMDAAALRRHRRSIGMMFQHGALLNSISVFDNVALPLREHTRMSEAEIAAEVHRILEAVDLEAVDDLLPGQLSGGMTKRAALARALVLRPALLLCDEPFSGLDPATVRLVEALLVRTNRRFGVTVVLTSHHVASTARSADHVVVLCDGRALEGSTAELRRSPEPRVQEFFAELADPTGAQPAVPPVAEASR
ncbi:MAG TPA: ATP-binding cassette domain-containing protein [Myxococcota bacterium]|nr:ATP-binding cassette domain-containing protein [Myxococcota bacterium]